MVKIQPVPQLLKLPGCDARLQVGVALDSPFALYKQNRNSTWNKVVNLLRVHPPSSHCGTRLKAV